MVSQCYEMYDALLLESTKDKRDRLRHDAMKMGEFGGMSMLGMGMGMGMRMGRNRPITSEQQRMKQIMSQINILNY